MAGKGASGADVRPQPTLRRDDLVLPFATEASGAKGRIVRLGQSVDTILSRHAFPEPVSEALGHALALTTMLGAPLEPGARLSLQTRTDGPLGFLFVEFQSPDRVRATASFSKERVAELIAGGGRVNEGKLLGKGHLALTLDPGDGRDPTQGIVALDGDSLTAAANTYFRQSEQLPSYIRLAVARHRKAGGGEGATRDWTWRAGGLIVQHPSHREPDDEESASTLAGESSEDWQRVRLLAATVEDHELLDPELAPDRLLLRLFHEEGVRVFDARPVAAYCRCSRDRVAMFLASFTRENLEGMSEADGSYSVTCEFCSTVYRFGNDELSKPGQE